MKKVSEICPEIFGISEKRYRQLAKEGRVPVPKNGLVDFEAAATAYIALLRDRMEDRESTLTEERRRKTAAEASMKEMEEQKMRGDLLDRKEIITHFVESIIALKTDLLALPRRLAKWPEAKEISHKYIIRLLTIYSTPKGKLKEVMKGEKIPKIKD